MTETRTLSQLAEELSLGRTSSQRLVEECLTRIQSPAGEGGRTFVAIQAEAARTAAQAMDLLRKAGAAPSRFAGIPISIKDLFDIEGQPTLAGSRVLAQRTPATRDATAVARLRHAGFVVVGRTNMTEFAYSGVGLNPHYGTPLGIWDREARRIPGGSSSGSAVSVADGMVHASLGSDTGGSCRIPAAFNHLVGYKPTASRVPTTGAFPLSTSLDSIGPIARSVECCAALDAILADEEPHLFGGSLAECRFAVPRSFVLDGMDEGVGKAFERALRVLAANGAQIQEIELSELGEIPGINAQGGFSAAESYAHHREMLKDHAENYDPRVRIRIEAGATMSAADYIHLQERRIHLQERVALRLQPYDALLYPTVPILPPRLADLEKDADYFRLNSLCLRNPAVINLLDGCSISIPMTARDDAPAGLMISALGGRDRKLFQLARLAEQALGA
jgi:aspartyl-tRNA(Asn)/glutamyl-tRNA(Gln) amidotransferase subunit A